ncbi:hypothetical protein [Oceanobacillus halophilus]|uniref:Flagellar hook-length control protein FliK n=1 Tax=Oceanobacillus halophilus TaxID=930130 RepID=A0A495ABX3_9BACI|nr:hypothetical protein [Oceanobacillus halophilus]RKQ37468.1 hypothetical protein D8M06_01290 [Oceanobacillus halophilus]
MAKIMPPSNQAFRNDQIVKGQVKKLYPNNKALIQLNSQSITARLETPLVVGGKYHFQVHISNHTLYLKVIGDKLKNQPKQDISALLQSLGIKASRINTTFIQLLMDEGIPFQKKELLHAFHLLQENKKNPQTMDVLKEMIVYRYPISKDILESLLINRNLSQTELMNRLLREPIQNNSINELQHLLAEVVGSDKVSVIADPKNQFIQHVQKYFQFAGLDFEYRLFNQLNQRKTIKSLLLEYIVKKDGSTHETALKLLQYLNGVQLQSINETDNFIHFNIQIPGEKIGLTKDFTMQFKSRKRKNGEMNSDYCRIYFFLELAHLKETTIEMHIQQRAVSITIYNNTDNLSILAKRYQPLLKEGLEKLDYYLTNINYKPIQQERKTNPFSEKTFSYQGVDYRI